MSGRRRSERFARLERAVADEYRRRGFSAERAAYIGRAVAGRVARAREEEKGMRRRRDAKGRFLPSSGGRKRRARRGRRRTTR